MSVYSVNVYPSSTTIKTGNWYYDAYAIVNASSNCNTDVRWYSNNTSIATVNASSGYIYAKAPGTTRIYAQSTVDSSKKDYITVTVTSGTICVDSVTLNRSSISLEKGDRYTLSATVCPTNATNKTISWRSTNTSVATVNGGVVTAKARGYAYIYAEAQDGSGEYDSCYVNVTEDILVTSVTVSPSSKTMNIGNSAYLYETVCPTNATNKCVKWSSNKTSVATVNPDTGLVIAQGAGTATITATAQDGSNKKGYCTITVNAPIRVTGIDVCPTSLTINVGDIEYLCASITPYNATNQTVTWCSSNENVATVGLYTGRISANMAGTTTITVTTADGGYSASCTVKVVGYGRFNNAKTNIITNEFVNLLGEKKVDIPVLDLFYTHTTEECIKIIIDNDYTITKIANELEVHKAFIQTILMRELWCLNLADIAGDELVQNYFVWKESCEYWEKQNTIYQATVPYPSPPIPLKEDSSVGLGQIFAKVAIAAYNHAIDSGYICGMPINSNDWHECKKVWYSLKDDDEYNIRMSSLNILSCIDEFGYSHNYNAFSADHCKHVFTRYNEDTDVINDYGEECYQYFLIFKKYI